MAVAKKIRRFMEDGSWIRRMFEEGIELKKQFGNENVFDLSLGNPILEPPPEFLAEFRRLAENPLPGMHRYMPNSGYEDTRAAVADALVHETGVPFTAREIVMTCGAAGALNVVLKTILDPGDEVIIFAPYFVEYGFYVDNNGGVTKAIPTDERFLPDPDVLEKAIGPKTRAVLINSPNNPSGVVYSAELLSSLGGVLRSKEGELGTEIFLLSDEPYRKLLYDGLEYPHIFRHHIRSIAATSHSKDLGLAGERIGFIAARPAYDGVSELMDGLNFCNRTLGFVNAPALMQHLVRHLQNVTVDVSDYERKRDFLYQNLSEMGYSMVKPQGAFYIFPKSPIDDDIQFVRELQKRNVLVVPGSGFGSPGHFRISYCVDDRTMEGCLLGFKEVAEKYGLS